MMCRARKLVAVVSALVSLLLAAAAPYASASIWTYPDCIAGPMSGFPICDSSLPAAQRAADLVSRLNVTEKISRLGDASPSIDRLGLPAHEWWSEALHGIAYSPGVNFAPYGQPFSNATSFPMPIGLGAAFDDALINAMGSVVSTEARAFANVGRAGLDFWTPNINPFRDPRWGRGQETPGEDPYHIARYVYQLVRGLQEGEDPRYYKVEADCKHYAGYDVENWQGNERYGFNAIISQQDLVEYYLPSFESCIRDAHVASIMCSYNAVNGIPMCANTHFLQDIARGAYGLDGWVTSDCDAVAVIIDNHHYTNSSGATVAAALSAGVDIDCGSYYSDNAAAALADGFITEAQIDVAMQRQFESMVRQGYFDDPNDQPYRQYGPDRVDTADARQLALTAALESIVLLKNDGTLPLQQSVSTIAIIGPMSNTSGFMQGNYNGAAPFLTSLLDGFAQTTPSITIVQATGCDVSGSSTSGFAAALAVASKADLVLYAGGIDDSVESEGNDRNDITFPGVQIKLIQQLETLGKPLVAVIFGGGQVDMTYIRDSASTNAIVWAGYPGQSGGVALAQVIAGKYSPAGRLPVTQYPGDYVNQVPMTDMSLRNSSTNPGRTYKFYTGQPVYAFGTGLSYTTFSYDWLSGSAAASMDLTHASPSARAHHHAQVGDVRPVFNIQDLMRTVARKNGALATAEDDRVVFTSYSVNVTNTGSSVTSDVVVLGFLTNQPNDAAVRDQAPISELYAYDRVHALAPGQTRTVEFYVTMRQVSLADAVTGDRWVHPGVVRMFIDVERKLVHEFELVGQPELLAPFPGSQAHKEQQQKQQQSQPVQHEQINVASSR